MSSLRIVFNNYFYSIYKFYYSIRNPVLKFLFFFVALAIYILNILLYVFSFGIISDKIIVLTGGYYIFGIFKENLDNSDRRARSDQRLARMMGVI